MKNKNVNIKFVLLTAVILIFLSAASGCMKMPEPNTVITVNTPAPQTPAAFHPMTEAPTAAPETGIPETGIPETQTPESSEPATDAPATAVPKADYSIFDNCAFVGNSTLHGLYQFGIITHGDFFTKVGLNVLSVYKQTTDTGTVPIIDELNNGNYKAVILLFGENELGWPSVDSFINKYSQLLTDVWARQPDAEIFIMGMPPVSKKVSDTSDKGITNENINIFNERLAQLANERGCNFITAPAALIGEDGALPAEASSDGIHLNMKYSRFWADHICLSVAAGLSD